MLCSEPIQRWRPSAATTKGGGLRPPPFVVSFVLAVNTGHILVLRRKTCALLRAKTSALLRRKTCAVLAARASLSPGASQFETVAKNSTFRFLEGSPLKRGSKTSVSHERAASGESSVSLKENPTVHRKVAFRLSGRRLFLQK